MGYYTLADFKLFAKRVGITDKVIEMIENSFLTREGKIVIKRIILKD